jgi:hypothetical protein
MPYQKGAVLLIKRTAPFHQIDRPFLVKGAVLFGCLLYRYAGAGMVGAKMSVIQVRADTFFSLYFNLFSYLCEN